MASVCALQGCEEGGEKGSGPTPPESLLWLPEGTGPWRELTTAWGTHPHPHGLTAPVSIAPSLQSKQKRSGLVSGAKLRDLPQGSGSAPPLLLSAYLELVGWRGGVCTD